MVTRATPVGRRARRRQAAIILALLGLVLLACHAGLNRLSRWRPVYRPLRVDMGEHVEGSFLAALDAGYEIGFDFRRSIPRDELERLVGTLDEPSPLDITWSVLEQGRPIAQGDSRDYLYISSGGTTLPGRLWRALLNEPFHRRRGGTIERGVGRFRARAGQRYRIRADVGATVEPLRATDPRLVVRVERRLWQWHARRVRPLVYAGLGCLWGVLLIVLAGRKGSRGGRDVQ